MEIFSLRPENGQSLIIDRDCQHKLRKRGNDMFRDGPIEILFCRVEDGRIVLSIKAPAGLNISLYDADSAE